MMWFIIILSSLTLIRSNLKSGSRASILSIADEDNKSLNNLLNVISTNRQRNLIQCFFMPDFIKLLFLFQHPDMCVWHREASETLPHLNIIPDFEIPHFLILFTETNC